MKNPLWKKYLSESWLLFVAIAIGLFAFGWFRVTVVCELDTSKFRQIIDLLPSDWRQFASVDFDWLVSYLGRTSTGFDEPMMISLLAAWAMVRGSDVVSGELSRGTMEMLLAQPVCRREVYLRHAMYTVVGLLLLSLVLWLGMAAGVWFATVKESTYPTIWIPVIDYRIPLQFLKPTVEVNRLSDYVNPVMFLPGVVNVFSVSVFFAGFAAMCSAFDRYRWRSLGVLAAFFFANASMKVVGKGSERFSWMENWCIFGLATDLMVRLPRWDCCRIVCCRCCWRRSCTSLVCGISNDETCQRRCRLRWLPDALSGVSSLYLRSRKSQ